LIGEIFDAFQLVNDEINNSQIIKNTSEIPGITLLSAKYVGIFNVKEWDRFNEIIGS